MATRLEHGGTGANLAPDGVGYVVKATSGARGLSIIPAPTLGQKVYLSCNKETLATGEVTYEWIVPVDCTLAEFFAGSWGHLRIAPTSDTEFIITYSGSTPIGSAIFVGGNQDCTFTGAENRVYAGERITIYDPAVNDATAGGVSFTITGVI